MTNLAFRRSVITCIFVGLLWIFASRVPAADYYVVPTNPGALNPYTSWNIAGTNIIDVVNVAMTNPGTRTVWVTNGEYFLTNQIEMTNIITVNSFSGNYSNTIVGYNGDTHTTRCFYVTSTGTVDGFTISNGHDMASNNYISGGGAYVSVGTIQNCKFAYNICSNAGTTTGGGGVYIAGGGIVSNCTFFTNMCYVNRINNGCSGGAVCLNGGKLLNCLVISNSAVGTYAGGILVRSASDVVSNCFITFNYNNGIAGGVLMGGGLVTDCVLSNNYSGGLGGGIYPQNSAARVKNCTIVNNYASSGGGVYLQYGGSVSNCNIYGNRSANYGGGVTILHGAGNVHIIDACRISNNYLSGNVRGAGGVYIGGFNDSSRGGGQVRNCLIMNNSNAYTGGLRGGGGVCLSNSAVDRATPYGLINCTIVDNYSTNLGGGVAVFGESNYIANCIIVSNRSFMSNSYADVYNHNENSNSYWYSCANPTSAPLTTVQGNITSDPAFADSGAGNWRLKTRSPCVNTGTNQSWMTGVFDLDGKQRIRYGVVDMGAYERIYDGSIYTVH